MWKTTTKLRFFGTVINLKSSNKQWLHHAKKKINSKTDMLFIHHCKVIKCKILLTEVAKERLLNKKSSGILKNVY